MVKYEYGVKNGVRFENILAINEKPLLIFPSAISHGNHEISKEVFDNGTVNKNVNHATKSITVTNSDKEHPLIVDWMRSQHFKDTKIIVDGVEIK